MEPCFMLCARDLSAPAAVRFWAARAEELGAPREIVEKARATARDMIAWQGNHGASLPGFVVD